MIIFESINFKIKFHGQSPDPRAAELPLIIQYFHFENQVWTSLYEEITTKYSLDIRKMASEVSSNNPVEAYFFDMVRAGLIPHIRIIPGAGALIYPEADKQIILSNIYSFSLNEELAAYEFDFGSLWLGTEESVIGITEMFPDVIPATSFFTTAVSQENVPVPINELYTNIVSEIETAAAASKSSAFKLSNISLKLKAVIHDEAGTMNASLLDLTNSENINGNAISELVFDITPVQQGEIRPEVVPDVTGLTETAVRRVLKTLGLRLNPVYQNNTTVVNGDSFKQSPAAGDAIQPNQLVTVIFSKHE